MHSFTLDQDPLPPPPRHTPNRPHRNDTATPSCDVGTHPAEPPRPITRREKRLREWEQDLTERERTVRIFEQHSLPESCLRRANQIIHTAIRSKSIDFGKQPNNQQVIIDVSGERFITTAMILRAQPSFLVSVLREAQEETTGDDVLTITIQGRCPRLFEDILTYLRLSIADSFDCLLDTVVCDSVPLMQWRKNPLVPTFAETLRARYCDPRRFRDALKQLHDEAVFFSMTSLQRLISEMTLTIDPSTAFEEVVSETVIDSLSTQSTMVLCLTLLTLETEALDPPSRMYIAAGDSECKITLFDITKCDNSFIVASFPAHVNMVTELMAFQVPKTWLPGGTSESPCQYFVPVLASASRDGRVCFWDVSRAPTISLANEARCSADSGFGHSSPTSSPEVRPRDVDTHWRPTLLKRVRAHAGYIQGLVGVWDNIGGEHSVPALIATASADGFVKVWMLRDVLTKAMETNINTWLGDSAGFDALGISEDYGSLHDHHRPHPLHNLPGHLSFMPEERIEHANLPTEFVYGRDGCRSLSMPIQIDANKPTKKEPATPSNPLYLSHRCSAAVRAIAYGTGLLFAALTQNILAIDIHSKTVIFEINTAFCHPIRCMDVTNLSGSFANPGLRSGTSLVIAVGTYAGELRLYDVTPGCEPTNLATSTLPTPPKVSHEKHWVADVKFVRGSLIAAAGAHLFTIRIGHRRGPFDESSTPLAFHTTKPTATTHENSIRRLLWIDNDALLATAGFDGQLKLFASAKSSHQQPP